MGLTFTIIGDLFSPAERGRYQGMFGAVFGLASVVGPLAGGWITDHLSWRWAFYVNAPLGIVAVARALFHLPVREAARHAAASSTGWASSALVGWIVPLLLALSRVNQRGWTDPSVPARWLDRAVASLVAFI